jgi:hypothetical protein
MVVVATAGGAEKDVSSHIFLPVRVEKPLEADHILVLQHAHDLQLTVLETLVLKDFLDCSALPSREERDLQMTRVCVCVCVCECECECECVCVCVCE